MASPFENFVNTELPQRPVIIKDAADATGNPNSSVLPKVIGAPLGAFYLQDDVSPKVLWQRRGPNSTDWEQVGGEGLPPMGGTALTISEADGTPTIPNVSSIIFDQATGFNVSNPALGVARISLGSHWKDINVSGQSTLTPSGEESIEFIAGDNVEILTNPSSTPQSILFNVSIPNQGPGLSNWTEDEYGNITPNGSSQDFGSVSDPVDNIYAHQIYAGPSSLWAGNEDVTQQFVNDMKNPGVGINYSPGSGYNIDFGLAPAEGVIHYTDLTPGDDNDADSTTWRFRADNEDQQLYSPNGTAIVTNQAANAYASHWFDIDIDGQAIDTIGGVNFDAYTLTNEANIVDMFYYNPSAEGSDSWRTDNTASWYNETSSSTRSATQAFPAEALIAAEADKITIYDVTGSSPSMWMIFNRASTNYTALGASGQEVSTVYMEAGILYIGRKGLVNSASTPLIGVVDFKNDLIYHTCINHENKAFIPVDNTVAARNVEDPISTTSTNANYVKLYQHYEDGTGPYNVYSIHINTVGSTKYLASYIRVSAYETKNYPSVSFGNLTTNNAKFAGWHNIYQNPNPNHGYSKIYLTSAGAVYIMTKMGGKFWSPAEGGFGVTKFASWSGKTGSNSGISADFWYYDGSTPSIKSSPTILLNNMFVSEGTGTNGNDEVFLGTSEGLVRIDLDVDAQSNSVVTKYNADPSPEVGSATFNGSSYGSFSTFNLSSSAHTVLCWVKMTDSSNGGTGWISNVILGHSPGASNYVLGIDSGKISSQIDTGTWRKVNGSTTISDGKWHFLAWVRENSTTLKMYVDGVLENTNTWTPNGYNFSRVGDYSGNIYNGIIKELMVYNGEIFNSSDIQSVYNEGLDGNISTHDNTNLLAYWKLNTDLTDSKGSYDLTPSGTITFNGPEYGVFPSSSENVTTVEGYTTNNPSLDELYVGTDSANGAVSVINPTLNTLSQTFRTAGSTNGANIPSNDIKEIDLVPGATAGESSMIVRAPGGGVFQITREGQDYSVVGGISPASGEVAVNPAIGRFLFAPGETPDGTMTVSYYVKFPTPATGIEYTPNVSLSYMDNPSTGLLNTHLDDIYTAIDNVSKRIYDNAAGWTGNFNVSEGVVYITNGLITSVSWE